MSNWPFDILTTIFSHLEDSLRDKKDIAQCSLACHNWNLASRSSLFKSVFIQSEEQLEKFLLVFEKNKLLGKYVKSINMEIFETDDLSVLPLIAKNFKNLEELYIKGEGVYNCLYELLKKDELFYLNTLSAPDDEYGDQNAAYTKCLNLRKHQMSSLTLTCPEAYETFFDKLDEFPNLKDFALFSVYVDFPHASVFDGIEEMDQKSNLQQIESFSFKEIHYEYFFKILANKSIAAVKPLPNLNFLEISTVDSFPIIDDKFMQYIMKKFPNLTHLSMNSDCTLCPPDLEVNTNPWNLSSSVTLKFLDYLFKLDAFQVFSIATRELTAEVVREFLKNLKEKSLKLPSRLSMFYGDDEPHDSTHLPSIHVDDRDFKRNDKKDYAIKVEFDPNDISGIRELELIEQAGHPFSKISVTYAPPAIHSRIMKCIAKYCVNLESMSISDGSSLMPIISNEQGDEEEDEGEEEVEEEDEEMEEGNLAKNYTLTKLEMKYYPKSLKNVSLYSKLFPSLKYLAIHCQTLKRYGSNRSLVASMPEIQLDHLYLRASFPNKTKSPPTPIIKWLCIKIRVEKEKTKHLLFKFQATRGEFRSDYSLYPMEFIKELDAFEFETIEDNPQYFVCRISCKSLKKFSFEYTTDNDQVSASTVHCHLDLLKRKIHVVDFPS